MKIEFIEKQSITSVKTLTSFLLTNETGEHKLIYVYNSDDKFFKVFFSIGRVIEYFSENGLEYFEREFTNADSVEKFLASVKFDNCNIIYYDRE